MDWFLGILLGAFLGVVLQLGLVALSSRYARRTRSIIRRLRFSAIAMDRAARWTRPHQAAHYASFFREAGPAKVDYAIYELSPRPTIPVMDLLYFEYLKKRLADGSITKLYIVAWDGSASQQVDLAMETTLVENLQKVFGPLWVHATIVTNSDLQKHANSVLSKDFMASLESLGNSTFLREASHILGYHFRSYHDINSGHPESLQARSLVEHAVRGWLVYKYLSMAPDIQANEPRTFASLLWERELSKLLLLNNLSNSGHSNNIGLMIGRSVSFRSGLKRRPIPTFGPDAICIFAEMSEISAACEGKTAQELAVTSEILDAILDVNVSTLSLPGWQLSETSSDRKLSRHASATLLQIAQVRRIYGLQ